MVRRTIFAATSLVTTLIVFGVSCGGTSLSSDDASTDDASDATVGADSPQIDAATTTIGPTGGTVTVSGVSLEVPAGALSSPVTITITVDSSSSPAGYVSLSPLYRFAPEGLSFAVPAIVHITACVFRAILNARFAAS